MASEVGEEPCVSEHPLPSLNRGVCFLPLEQKVFLVHVYH